MGRADRLEKIECWQVAMRLARRSYALTDSPRFAQHRSLGYQIRRACVSIPANIAEGFGRSSSRDFAHFVDIARGSAFELDTLLRLSKSFDLIETIDYETNRELIDLLIPKLTAFARYLRSAKNPYR